MIHLGLVGHPLHSSFSPAIHRAALEASNLSGEYALYPVRPGDLQALARMTDRLRAAELTGLNVTIPHKRAIVGFLDELTPAAQAIGAVNAFCLSGGRLVGENTDAAGFLADLRTLMPSPRSAIILGAGGAARAVVYALRSAGCEVVVAARRLEQARELAGQFAGVQAIELCAQGLAGRATELVVNATPVGMFPHVDQCPWPPGLPLPREAAVYDLIYNPRETSLMTIARAAGLQAAGGLGMLIEQAALAFELWTGCRVSRELLQDAVGQKARSPMDLEA